MAKTRNMLSFKQNDNNLAIAYYRYSSSSQNEASLDQQREKAREWAKAHNYTIVKEYQDAAISGTTDKRPGFQLMLNEVGTIKPAVLILWKSDRLGRDRLVLAQARADITKAGCRIQSVTESMPEDYAGALIMESVLDMISVNYSVNLSTNIRRGIKYNAEHGLYNGHKVFGYAVNEASKKYIVDTDTAPAVRKAFADYADGTSMQRVADDLNEAGFRSVRNGKFTVSTVNKMFRNRRYIGEYSESGITIPDGMPVLIDMELWERVQKRMETNKRLGAKTKEQLKDYDGPRYWLTGNLVCGRCHGPMQGVSGTSKTGAKHYYYYCKNQRAKKCDRKSVRKEQLESIVEWMLIGLMENTEYVASLAVDTAKYWKDTRGDGLYLKSLQAQLKDVNERLQHVVDAIEKGALIDALVQRMTKLDEQKKSLEDQIQAEQVKAELFDKEHNVKAYFQKFMDANTGDPAVRKVIYEYFVDKIVLGDEDVEMTFQYDNMNPEVEPLDPFGTTDEANPKHVCLEFDRSPSGGDAGN